MNKLVKTGILAGLVAFCASSLSAQLTTTVFFDDFGTTGGAFDTTTYSTQAEAPTLVDLGGSNYAASQGHLDTTVNRAGFGVKSTTSGLSDTQAYFSFDYVAPTADNGAVINFAIAGNNYGSGKQKMFGLDLATTGSGSYEFIFNNTGSSFSYDTGDGWTGTLAANSVVYRIDGGSETTVALAWGVDVSSGVDAQTFGFFVNKNDPNLTGTFTVDNLEARVAVPEPSTIALLSGMAALGFVIYRRRR
jgi:hypothetical protein